MSGPQPQWQSDDQQWSLPPGGQASAAYDPGVASQSAPPVSGQPGYQQQAYQQQAYPQQAYPQQSYQQQTYQQPAYPAAGYQAAEATYPVTSPAVHHGDLIPAQDASPVLVQIAEIQVTAVTIRTPLGEVPLRGSSWMVQDQWATSQRTPGWAIACAILGFFCLTVFSLLFLLAKETTCSGMVNIVVTNGSFQYQTRIPVTSQVQVHHVHQQVNYVRALACR